MALWIPIATLNDGVPFPQPVCDVYISTGIRGWSPEKQWLAYLKFPVLTA